MGFSGCVVGVARSALFGILLAAIRRLTCPAAHSSSRGAQQGGNVAGSQVGKARGGMNGPAGDLGWLQAGCFDDMPRNSLGNRWQVALAVKAAGLDLGDRLKAQRLQARHADRHERQAFIDLAQC